MANFSFWSAGGDIYFGFTIALRIVTNMNSNCDISSLPDYLLCKCPQFFVNLIF